jgi:hypothetical protein
VEIINNDPSFENSILLTFPTPFGRSIVYYLIYLKSEVEYVFILFSPAIQTLLLVELTAIAYKGALKTLLLMI